MKTTVKFLFSTLVAAAAMSSTMLAAEDNFIYVSSDYNSSTEGYGTTHFSNYAGAYAYAAANNSKATIVIEKTNTLSGNTFDNNHKNYSKLAVVVNDGAVVGNAASKWDMTYAVTVEAGGILQTARPVSASHGNSHIKNTLTIGEAGEGKETAYVKFQHASGVDYKTASIAVLYNGKLIANNADIEVGDLGFTGSATINDSIVDVEGVVAFGKNNFYKQTMTNTTMTVRGHNLMNENTYYSTTGTILNKLTMTNSSITVDDGVEDTVAEAVTIKELTMNSGSALTVEVGTAVKVEGKFDFNDSTLKVGALTIGTNGKFNVSGKSSLDITTLSGVIEVDDSATLTDTMIGGGLSFGYKSKLDDGKTLTFEGNSKVGTLYVGNKINVEGASPNYTDGETHNVLVKGNLTAGTLNNRATSVTTVEKGASLVVGDTINRGQLIVKGNMTIDTASAGAGTGHFEINEDDTESASASLVIDGGVLTDNNAGGYIAIGANGGGASTDVKAYMELKNNAIFTSAGKVYVANGEGNRISIDGSTFTAGELVNNGQVSVTDSTLSVNAISGSGDIYLSGTINVLDSLTTKGLTIVEGSTLNVGEASTSGVALMAELDTISFETLTIIATDVKVGDVLDMSEIIRGNGDELILGKLTEGTQFMVIASDNNNKEFTAVYTSASGGCVSIIPEPSSFGLFAGLGALLLVGTRRRRR